MSAKLTLTDVRAAAARIAGGVMETPCRYSAGLSQVAGMEICCKPEYLQRTGSFKERGACNALIQLSADRKQRGVVAASAGNHALGLAWHGQRLGIPVTVVMPRFAPLTKVVNCRRLGARVVLHGDTLTEARARADELTASEGLTYINGFDDPDIIAGQGTIGLEIAEQVADADAVVVSVGGGGLIAGVSLALKAIKPGIQVIGVEPRNAASYTAALAAEGPVPFQLRPTLADGLSVAKVGENAFGIARELVDRTVLVEERDIALAILRLMEVEKCVVEGAGAAPLAACLAGLLPELAGKKVVLLLSGGNIDMTTLGRLIEHGLVSDGRICRFTATISDRPGGLARFAGLIGEAGGSIKEITHDRLFGGDDIQTVNVHCIVETRDAQHIVALREQLAKEGFRVV
jgi:threonine dehydratase